MNKDMGPLECKVNEHSRILINSFKSALHVAIPIEGQIYYSKNTELPKSLAISLVSAYQSIIAISGWGVGTIVYEAVKYFQ